MAQGRPVVHIAQSLGVSRRSLYNWLARYTHSRDPMALQDQRGGGRPSVWSSELTALFAVSIERPPDAWGYQAVEWTVPLMVAHLATLSGQRVSTAGVRRQLRRLGYVWKRPRYVLRPDPAREKKARHPPPTRPAGAAQRRAVRGRDRFALVSAAAGVLGQAGARSPGFSCTPD